MRLAALSVGLVLTSEAQAELLCEDLNAFFDQVRSEPKTLPDPLPGAQGCGVSKTIDGTEAVHCNWSYPYRGAEAKAAIDQIVRSIHSCFADAAVAAVDLGVNHPDSYDLRQFLVDGALVSVSLKDKSALGETYVFLRAEARP